MRLAIIFESQSITVEYPADAARALMVEWLSGTIAPRFGFHAESDGAMSAVER